MRASATAIQATNLGTGSAGAGHVFTDPPPLGPADTGLAGLIDTDFLAEIGWDPTTSVMLVPAGHLLLGRPVCQAQGCETKVPAYGRTCQRCQGLLAEQGLGPDDVGLLAARLYPASRGIGHCQVAGCCREWTSGRTLLLSLIHI